VGKTGLAHLYIGRDEAAHGGGVGVGHDVLFVVYIRPREASFEYKKKKKIKKKKKKKKKKKQQFF
jgi:hypothetical protein